VDGRGTTAHFLTGRRRALAGVLAIVLVAGLAVSAFAPNGSNASSHREAPYISTDPNADGTDLYAFVSPDDPSTVTLIANYIPLEEPAGGPNFNTFGDDVRYAFQIDNDGDAKTDIYYRFRFDTPLVALALSGGLLPSPTALVVLLGAVALHRIAFGVALVAAFSVGLAGALTLLGLLVLRARSYAAARFSTSSISLLPIGSTALILAMGLFLTTRAALGL
jgi:Domain of unknown function (DUF4331)